MKSLIPVLILVIIIPITMIVFGVIFEKNPPQEVNWIYGYRTRRSRKNNKTWNFAQLYMAKVWRWSGIVLFIFSLIFVLLFKESYKEIPGWIFHIQLAVMLLSVVATEFALYKKFDKEGNLR